MSKSKSNDIRKWELCFAWYPVVWKKGEGINEILWLEKVYRRKTHSFFWIPRYEYIAMYEKDIMFLVHKINRELDGLEELLDKTKEKMGGLW